MKRLCVVFAVVLLSSCNAKASDEYLGIWEYNETYLLTIEKNGKTYSAEFYGKDFGEKTYKKRIYPASIKDGVLSIAHNQGAIPVLYDATEQSLILQGRQKYKKLSPEEATVSIANIDELLTQQEADQAMCEKLQALINEKIKENLTKELWNRYIDEEFNPQIPSGCRIIGDGRAF